MDGKFWVTIEMKDEHLLVPFGHLPKEEHYTFFRLLRPVS
jgi:hypothetical protein